MSQPDRQGMSRLDVVVVLVAFLLIAAVCIPQIQDAREAARNTYCRKRFKQLGIGLHNYHETFGSFPAGWVPVPDPDSDDSETSAYGWSTLILPFLDLSTLYRQGIDFGSETPAFQSQAGRKPFYASSAQEQFRCASDISVSHDSTASIPDLAPSNYVANFGVGVPAFRHSRAFLQGVFGENSYIRILDILDGTCNVVLTSERRSPRPAMHWEPGKLEGHFYTYWAGIPRGTHPLAVVGTVTDGVLRHSGSPDAERRFADNTADVLNTKGPLNGTSGPIPVLKTLKPNVLSDGTPMEHFEQSAVSGGYSSYHPRGFMIGLGDGSARFVSNNVDPQTYINLMRRADGVTLGEF